MTDWILILLIVAGLLTLLGLFLVIFLWKKRKEGAVEPDYRAFFILGIIFAPMGIVLSVIVTWALLGITALGVIYLIIGLTNRDKWKT
ncbi:MAG: hypothetical protein GKC03_04670 [Methanomassiliicoccales archaeon]|nr:hypothetical protein [Methanomassiliicoccales archaeon]NYT15765.1 hypothetical protein [Methanomassiliicoccales archaeon]